MKSVVVESPFAGETKHDAKERRNIKYAQFCLHDCLVNHNESPFASHLLYTQDNVLDDTIPAERKLGIDAGLEWSRQANETVCYEDLGISNGMIYGMKFAEDVGRPIVHRKLPTNLWNKFVAILTNEEFDTLPGTIQ